MTPERIAEVVSDPFAATLHDLLTLMREMGAATQKISGDDADGRPVFAVLLAVGDEAARLLPEFDRLTAEEVPE